MTLDVVIVGYGPVGAVLANLLGRDGIDVAVFEPSHDVYHLPRAAHFDDEVMRVFQSIGLASAVLRTAAPVRGMDFVAADGTVLFGFSADDRPRRHGWEAGYMFYQPDLETELRAAIERRPSVDVHLGHEVVALVPDDDGVAVTVRNTSTGAVTTARAAYVVGCDGARSFVRRELGIELDDSGFDQPWLVVDTMLRADAHVELPDRILQICDPRRPTTFVPSAGAHRRWEFMAVDGETADDLLDPVRIAELLAPWVTVGCDVDVIRTAVYSFHALVARSWRRGRVLLAGDAAHQMPPFLGQGMCAGIRDTANLSWKLAMVLDGRATDGLLDTYQQEREAHVRAIIELAVSLGGIIQTTDPAIAAARDESLRSSAGAAGEAPGMPALGRALGHGTSAAVGRPFPQPAPGDDEQLGHGFAAVGPLAPSSGIEAIGGRSIRRPAGPTTIVRPDRYVYAVIDNDAALGAAMHALRTALSTSS